MTHRIESIMELVAKKKDARKTWFDGSHPLFIYGTGTFAQAVQRALADKELPVHGFLDHLNSDTTFLCGLPIYTPENAKEANIVPSKAIVILAIHNREADILKVKQNLSWLGYENILSSVDVYDHLADELGSRYWLTSRDFYSRHSSELEETFNLFTDDTSRAIFSSLLYFRITGDYSILPAPDFQHQYFPPDLPAWHTPLRLIDCGAYNGDVIEGLLKAGFTIGALAAFEPEANNYKMLVEFARKKLQNIRESSLWPCGIYSSTTQLYFQSGHAEASSLSRRGDTTVQCVALDDALPTFSPNLIKMDIEGAEMDALQGAEKILIRSRPSLAISVYHTPAHLWEIPLHISNLVRKNKLHYTYHIRAHANNCFDTVFYAVSQG